MSAPLNTRTIIATSAVALFLFFTSAYISLRLGALPWPIIFSIVASAGILRLTGKDLDRHQINTAQAGGSIGGLVAAAVAFVLPGLYLQADLTMPPIWAMSLLAVVSAITGILLAYRVRHQYIEVENLPYPAGRAGGELIKAGFDHGQLFKYVVVTATIMAAFTLTRDALDLYIVPLALGPFVLYFLISPMGVGAGYILGQKTGVNWLAGAIIGIFVLVPLGENLLNHTDHSVTPLIWAKNIGMGMVLGSGIAHIVFHGRMAGWKALLRSPLATKPVMGLTIVAIPLLMICGVSWWAAAVTVIFGWLLVPVASKLTGATNLDPLEQFGILAVFLISVIYLVMKMPLPVESKYVIAFYIAAMTAVAGDIGHDFKSAQVVGTPPRNVVYADIIAAIVLLPAIPVLLNAMRTTFAPMLFTAEMPAPQAQIVYNTFAGEIDVVAFTGAMIVTILAEAMFALRYSRRGKEPIIQFIPLGIGIFLGWPLSFVIALGGVIRAWVQRRYPDRVESGIVIAAGIMGGEGITGFITTILEFSAQVDMLLIRGLGIILMLWMAIWFSRRRD